MPEWYEIVVGLLAAVGGGGGLLAAWKAWMSWRDGVQQRESAPTERLVAHLEKRLAEQGERIAHLEAAREIDGAYITLLVLTMAGAGIAPPPRPAPPEKS
jgi:hypothetical protein